MNIELWLVILPALGWLLFSLGGTQISQTIPGQKWIRRFLLPIIMGACVYFAGFQWFQAVGVTLFSCASFHLGYGDKVPWKRKWLVFASYGVISLPIGVSIWNMITVGGCVVMFLLSNFKLTAQIVVWKIVEGFFGALCCIQVAYLLAGYGTVWGTRP